MYLCLFTHIYIHNHKHQRECHVWGQSDRCKEVQEYTAVTPKNTFFLMFYTIRSWEETSAIPPLTERK